MKKSRFLIGCSLMSLTAFGCGNYVRQGEQVDPQAATAKVSPGYSATASGLKYRIVREGNATKPGPQDTVTVHYRGTLEDGTEFDSSYKRGQTISFPLGQVIAGWTEGLQLIGEGGEVELIIPPDLGYGAGGSPPVIPGNATLHFRVELFKVN